MNAVAVGQPLRRIEDDRLLRGTGRYVGDIALPGQLHAAFARSQHAHARIRACDTAAARAAEGVAAVFTGADIAADGLPGVPVEVLPPSLSRLPLEAQTWEPPPWPALAHDRVRHVGDALALVVAENECAAREAAELVTVDYAPLDAVTAPDAAVEAGAPAVWPDHAANTCFRHEAGDHEATEVAFAAAAHVTRLGLVNNRIVAAPLEPRNAVAAFDAASGRFMLYTGTQKPHQLRDALARKVFRMRPEEVRVISPDVGGGFGARNGLYPEFIALLWAARRLERPVKWIAERREGFLSDVHGRDNVTEAALALDAHGRFLAVRASTLVNLGAYVAPRAMVPTANGLQMLTGPYRVGAAYAEVRGVFTNTSPTHVYRGAGRPEGCYVLERLVDRAARETGRDPVALRRRNLIPAAEMPYTTAMGSTYDGGDLTRTLEDALACAGLAGFSARQAAAERRGLRRGIGLALFIEHLHAKGHHDDAEITLSADGRATLTVGSCANGQGHETVFSQLAAAALGLPLDAVRVVQGDTGLVAAGHGTGASQSATLAGGAVATAVEGLIERGREVAAALLEAGTEDVAFERGRYRIAGTDRAVALPEVAAAAERSDGLPAALAGPLRFATTYTAPADTFPNGCHVAEVEVDPETGSVAIARYTAVQDFGRLLNPLVVEGQLHGAIAQGIGQALLERAAYDPATGQMQAASFLDYALPRGDDLPSLDVTLYEGSRGETPLGVKGCGEAGCSGAPPALVNAVLDALAPLGVRDLSMPLTPHAVYAAIKDARQR